MAKKPVTELPKPDEFVSECEKHSTTPCINKDTPESDMVKAHPTEVGRAVVDTILQELDTVFINRNFAKDEEIYHGYGLIVLSAGFIYIGHLYTNRNWAMIKGKNRWNLRSYATEGGLGRISVMGIEGQTSVDKCSEIICPISEFKHIMVMGPEAIANCDESKVKVAAKT